MVQQHWDEKAIFKVAFNIVSTEAREEYLRQVCGNQPELLERVQTLLQRHDEAQSFLESPPSGLMATVQTPSQPSPQIPSQSSSHLEGPGTCIGPYKLRELLGEGGMGAVYVAEQEKPLRRKVAVKVIKPGMDSRDVISRFEAERQALALMDHTNIAKVLDAGTTAAGRPYFVMELVKGLTITEHCDQYKLGTRQRLELFLQVCQAVQHAHQKGIIHRDLKPSNVIVTMHDTVPVVKVIDFGVAKAIGQQLTEHTLYTGFSQMIGTPLYMSPEQAGQSSIDIDTRSDIYSLGVMLYELLTGCTPFESETLKRVGFDEMRRMIREVDPPRPSARVSTLNAEILSTIAEHRQVEPRVLRRQIHGELDWIVMKAMEKDRNRRYETVNGLTADVQRYLNDEPVQACPPSASYRFRKFVRRNKVTLTSAAVLLFVAGSFLLATTLVAIGQRRVAFSLQELTQRRLAVQVGINAALAEVAQLRQQSQAAGGGRDRDTETRIRDQLNRALALTQAEPTPPAVATHVQRLAKEFVEQSRDQQLLDALDEAWIAQANTNPNDARWAPEQCIPRLSKALAARGLIVDETPPEEAAAGIRSMPEKLRAPVLVALEEWARCRTISPGIRLLPAVDESSQASTALNKTESMRNGFHSMWHRDLTPEQRESLVGFTGKEGVLIVDVSHDGPVDKLRLKAGDIVTKLNGIPTSSSSELSKTLAALAPGTVVDLAVFRDGRTHNTPFTVGARHGSLTPLRTLDRIVGYQLGRDGPMVARGANIVFAYTGRVLSPALGTTVRLQVIHFGQAEAKTYEIVPDPIFNWLRSVINFADNDPWRQRMRQSADLVDNVETRTTLEKIADDVNIEQQPVRILTSLAEGLQKTGSSNRAIQLLYLVQRRFPGDVHANISLADTLRKADPPRLEEAARYYTAAIALCPASACTRVNFGVLLNDLGKPEEAIEQYREALRVQPDFYLPVSNICSLLYKQGKRDEMIAEWRKFVERNPNDGRARYGLGTALMNQENLEEAETQLRDSVRLDPNQSPFHINLASVLRRQGKFDEAIEQYREGLKRFPGFGFRTMIAGVLEDQGRLDEAIAELREAIRLNPKDAGAHNNLGALLNKQGRLVQAIAEYQESIRVNPRQWHPHANLAMLRANSTQPEFRDLGEAMALARKAVELAPQAIWPLYTMGMVHFRAGNWKDAQADLQKAYDHDQNPQWQEDICSAWFCLAMAHWQLGEKDKARTWFEKAASWMDKCKSQDEVLYLCRAETEELLGVKQPSPSGNKLPRSEKKEPEK